MKSHAILILGLLMITWVPPSSWASDQNRGTCLDQQLDRVGDLSLERHDLRDMLCDMTQWQMLFRDRERIRGMLRQSELRREMLQHPGFMRQMMQLREMRWELLQNEQMIYEMFQNRDIRRELISNPKMMEEVKKNKSFEKANQEQQEDLLEELLLESTTSGAASHPHAPLSPLPKASEGR